MSDANDEAGRALLWAGAGASAGGGGSGGVADCDWTVFYDRWLGGFDAEEYRSVDEGGVHCLEECCQDASCQGLLMVSAERFQCYKYTRKPNLSSAGQGRPLGDGQWLRDLPSKWSVLMKQGHHQESPLPVTSALAGGASAEAGAGAEGGSAGAEGAACGEWEVHYDLWLPSFSPGVYGFHQEAGLKVKDGCLEACCKDPFCQGLAMESSINRQCYRYRSLPHRLTYASALATRRPLGNGHWLREKPKRWSVLVKMPPKPGVQPPALLPLPWNTHQQKPAIAHEDFPSCDWVVHYGVVAPGAEPVQLADLGGLTCFEWCCADAACLGVAMTSGAEEVHKCSRYSHVPVSALLSGGGRTLGDGEWLADLADEWSTFLKGNSTRAAKPTAAAAATPAPAPAPTPALAAAVAVRAHAPAAAGSVQEEEEASAVGAATETPAPTPPPVTLPAQAASAEATSPNQFFPLAAWAPSSTLVMSPATDWVQLATAAGVAVFVLRCCCCCSTAAGASSKDLADATRAPLRNKAKDDGHPGIGLAVKSFAAGGYQGETAEMRDLL